MYKKALVLAPHTDDGEFGCGGTIHKLVEQGCEVHYAAFSVCELSIPDGLPKDILEVEVKEATKALGIHKENLHIFKYPVRTFPENRQPILEDLIKLRKEINPDLVLLPSPNDIHQDHYTISIEGTRAFKNTTLLGYEIIWNNLTINTQCFNILEKRHIDKKIEALDCYKSQKGRNYANSEFIKSLACIRGTQIGAQYAEVFEVIRQIL